MDRDYVLIAAGIICSSSVLMLVAYLIYRRGIALRLALSQAVLLAVASAAAFALGKEGITLAGTGIGMGIVLLVAILLSVHLGRRIVLPIRQMVGVAEGLSRGELDHALAIGSKDELGDMADAFTLSLAYLQHLSVVGEALARGDSTVDAAPRSGGDVLGNAMAKINDSIRSLAADLDTLAQAVVAGTLDVRADATGHGGDYHRIVVGVNAALDAVSGPLKVMIAHVGRISQGDLSEMIDGEYQGDLSEVSSSLNRLVATLNEMSTQVQTLYTRHKAGEFGAVIPTEQFAGSFQRMAEWINESLRVYVRTLVKILDTLSSYAKGDFGPVLEGLVGNQTLASQKMDALRNNLRGLVAEVASLSRAVAAGELNARADETRFQGNWSALVRGLNATVTGLVGFLDSVPTPIMIVDPEYNIRYLNPAGATMVGVPADSAVGAKCYELLKTTDCRTDNCTCTRAMQSGAEAASQAQAELDGRGVDIALTGVPIIDRNGAVLGAIEIMMDQTAAKRAVGLAKKIGEFQEMEVYRLQDSLDKLAKGDLSITMQVAQGDDDTAATQEAFEAMAAALNHSVDSLRDMTNGDVDDY